MEKERETAMALMKTRHSGIDIVELKQNGGERKKRKKMSIGDTNP